MEEIVPPLKTLKKGQRGVVGGPYLAGEYQEAGTIKGRVLSEVSPGSGQVEDILLF
jgi:hypothetical protein